VTTLKTTSAFIFCLSLVVLMLGCDGDQTAPERSRPDHVDPIDWDGTKDGPSVPRPLADGPSREWPHAGFDAGEHSLGMELRPHDHTVIMETILQNAPEIAARLPQNQVSSGTDVLQAVLEVPGISAYVKGRIRIVLDVLPSVEEAQSRMSQDMQQAMAEALEQIEECATLSEMTEAMEGMIDSGRYDAYAGLPQGLAAGIRILRDGERTIYRPRVLFNLKRMLQQDLKGAIGGAIGGAIVGGPPGAGLGALAGAAGSSGSDAVGQITGWW
jgi:hypothetical protein